METINLLQWFLAFRVTSRLFIHLQPIYSLALESQRFHKDLQGRTGSSNYSGKDKTQ